MMDTNLRLIKLDLTDQKIITELDKNSRISTSKLAKNIKISREIVKYRIKNMEKKNIIDNYITIIDPTKLGYQMYKIHLELSNKPEERTRFYMYLRSMSCVFWVGFCDGSWDVIVTIFAKDSMQLYEIMKNFLSEFRQLIVKRSIGNFVHAHFFTKAFLTGHSSEKFTIGNQVVHNKIDNLDKNILYILANNARQPITEIANKLDSNPSIIRNRIKTLEDKKIIMGYKVDLYLKKLHLETYKLFIYFNHMDQKRKNSLIEYIKQNPRATIYVRVIAAWGGELEFVVHNHREFNEITNDLRQKFSDIIRGYESVLINEEYWMPAIKF